MSFHISLQQCFTHIFNDMQGKMFPDEPHQDATPHDLHDPHDPHDTDHLNMDDPRDPFDPGNNDASNMDDSTACTVSLLISRTSNELCFLV
jgi:hypothetical protein